MIPRAAPCRRVIIDGILKRPEFAGVHVVPVSKGEGAGALARGEGDMAIQLVPEILNKPQIDLVAPLPVELGGHMDAILAVSARAADQKNALAFVKFLASPEARSAWVAKGLEAFLSYFGVSTMPPRLPHRLRLGPGDIAQEGFRVGRIGGDFQHRRRHIHMQAQIVGKRPNHLRALDHDLFGDGAAAEWRIAARDGVTDQALDRTRARPRRIPAA